MNGMLAVLQRRLRAPEALDLSRDQRRRFGDDVALNPTRPRRLRSSSSAAKVAADGCW
jgi:hypothetical protein